jgi:hypothetical protein
MPTDKDFKRLVRGRKQKTGESYTSARAHLRKQKPTAAVARARPTMPSSPAGAMPSYKIPGWWAQTVTVGYERIKGLRAVGEASGSGLGDAHEAVLV